MATATRLRLRSTITRLQNTATQLQAMWHLARQERPLLSWRRALRPTQHHRWRPVIITPHPAIGVATGAGVPVGDSRRPAHVQIRYNNGAAPRQGAAFLFMLFARQVAEPCARASSLCSLRFLLGLLFHDAIPCC